MVLQTNLSLAGSLPRGGSDVSTWDFGTIENWLQSFPLINHPKCGVEAKKRTTAIYQVRIGLDHWHVPCNMGNARFEGTVLNGGALLECVSSHSQAFDLTHVWYLQLLVPRMVFSCSKNRVPLNRSTCTLFSRAQMMVHFHVHDIHFFAASSFLNGTPLQGTATSMSCAVLSDETVAKRAETPAEHSPLDCRTIPQRKDANKKSPADPSR